MFKVYFTPWIGLLCLAQKTKQSSQKLGLVYVNILHLKIYLFIFFFLIENLFRLWKGLT